MAYWMTRDMVLGELSKVVEVWASRPHANISTEPRSGQRCVTWLCDAEELDAGARLGEWRVEAAVAYVGPGVPEDERQCTRVEGEPPHKLLSVCLDDGPRRRRPRDTEPF